VVIANEVVERINEDTELLCCLKISKFEASPFGHINVYLDKESTADKDSFKCSIDENNKKIKHLNDIEKEESKTASQLEYTKYFDEYFPITNEEISQHGLKHHYRVEIHRAMVQDEAFNMYKKYDASIHQKDSSKEGFNRFL